MGFLSDAIGRVSRAAAGGFSTSGICGALSCAIARPATNMDSATSAASVHKIGFDLMIRFMMRSLPVNADYPLLVTA